MTNDSPAATLQYVPGDAYQAGVCNIGPAEIRRRRTVGHVGLVASLVLLGGLVMIGAPAILRLAVLVPAAVSASGYLQAYLRFCANYGWRGIFNVGEIGDDTAVIDATARAADRRRAVGIGLASLAVGLATGLVAVFLPI